MADMTFDFEGAKPEERLQTEAARSREKKIVCRYVSQAAELRGRQTGC
jgi:hypothetical protein